MVRASLPPFGEDVDRQTDEDGIQAAAGYIYAEGVLDINNQNHYHTESNGSTHLPQSNQGQQIESHRPQYNEPEAQSVQARGQQVPQCAA